MHLPLTRLDLVTLYIHIYIYIHVVVNWWTILFIWLVLIHSPFSNLNWLPTSRLVYINFLSLSLSVSGEMHHTYMEDNCRCWGLPAFKIHFLFAICMFNASMVSNVISCDLDVRVVGFMVHPSLVVSNDIYPLASQLNKSIHPSQLQTQLIQYHRRILLIFIIV